MTWFKVDDTLAFHSKVVAAGNEAIGLWTRAGSWSAQQLTDGFVPAHIAATLGRPAEIRRLLQVGLWTPVDGGYEFHDWLEYQPSRTQVEADRAAAAERQRRARQKAAESRRDARRDSRDQSQGDDTVSHGPPVPSRPDPTYKHLLTLVVRRLSGGARDETTDDEIALWQQTAGPHVDLAAELRAWLVRNADTDLADPSAALLGWLRGAADRVPAEQRPAKPPCTTCGGQGTVEDGDNAARRCPTCKPPLRSVGGAA